MVRPLFPLSVIASAPLALSPSHAAKEEAFITLYRQAVGGTPELKSAARDALYPLDSEDRLALPVSPKVQQLLTPLAPTLRLLREAGNTPGGPWSSDAPALDPGSNFHLLLSLPSTQALLDLQEGREDHAVANLRSGLLLVRRARWNLSPLISAVLCDAVESVDHRIIAQLIHRLSPEALKRLADTLAQLPESPSLKEAALSCLSDPILDEALKRLRAGRLTDDDKALLDQIKLPRDADACDAIIADYRADIRALAPLLDQPFPAAYHDTVRFVDGVRTGRGENHPSSTFLLTDLSAVRIRLQRDIYLALVHTAIAIHLHGPEAVGQSRDPFTGKPFAYEKTHDGFTLTSEFLQNDKPLSLTFQDRK